MQDTIDDTRLHRYFDGDLSAEEAERVRRALDADPALRAKLDGLREVRALVRESVAGDLRGEPIASDDLWARIEAGLDGAGVVGEGLDGEPRKSAPVERPQLRAIPGGAATAGRGGGGPAPAPSPELRGRRIAGVVVGALALAAAVLLIVLRPGEPGPTEAPIAEGPGSGSSGGAESPERSPDLGGSDAIDLAAIGEEVASTEVIEVDFGENSGAIFSVEGDDGERYAVVWLADVQPKPTAVE